MREIGIYKGGRVIPLWEVAKYITKYLSINSPRLEIEPLLKGTGKTRKERSYILKKLKTYLEAQGVEALVEEVKKIAKDSLEGKNNTNAYCFSPNTI